jgi:hypothetical protein
MKIPSALLFVGINVVMVTSLNSTPLTPLQALLLLLMSLGAAICLATFVGTAHLEQCERLRIEVQKLREQSKLRQETLQKLKQEVEQRQQ